MKKHFAAFFSILSFCTVDASFQERWLNQFQMTQKSGYQLQLDRINREIVADIRYVADECEEDQKSALLDTIGSNSVKKSCQTISAFDFMKQKGIDEKIIKSIQNQEQEEYDKLINKLDKFFKNEPKWEFFKTHNLSPKDINTGYFMESAQECIHLNKVLKQHINAQKLFDKFECRMKSITENNIKNIKQCALKNHLENDRNWLILSHEIFDKRNLDARSYLISSFDIKTSEVSPELREILEKSVAQESHIQGKFEKLLNKYNQLIDVFFYTQMVNLGLIPDKKTEGQLVAEKIVTENIENEIYKSSRNPDKKEIEDLKDLRLIAEKHGVNEIRIIDAESLIKALHLDEDEKNRLLNLLKNGTQEEIGNEIENFIKNSKFEEESDSSNERLREYVKNCLVKGAKKSSVYRDEIITCIAWSKANEAALYDVAMERKSLLKDRSICFHFDKESRAGYNDIFLNDQDGFEYGLSSDRLSHCVSHLYKAEEVIFHEIGHVISGNMSLATEVPLESYLNTQSSDMVMEIAGESIILQDENLLKRSVRKGLQQIGNLVDFCTSGQMSNFIKEKFMEGLGEFCEQIVLPQKRESKIKLFDKLCSSKTLFTRILLFQQPVEAMQIMGLHTGIHNDKNVLYLNKLSDCAHSVLTGNYIRVNHLGWSKELSFDGCIGGPIVLPIFNCLMKGNVGINLDFYKALIKAYGCDPDDYFKRLEENKDK